MRLGVILVGDELLLGRVRDANLREIAWWAGGLGAQVAEARVLPDRVEVVAQALRELLRELDGVVLSGGLGPTQDDLTREAVARALGLGLPEDPRARKMVSERARALSYPLSEENLRRYSLVPDGFEPIPNPVGIAPGLLGFSGDKPVLSVPGPPSECAGVLERAKEKLARLWGPPPKFVELSVAGLREVEIEEKLKGLGPMALNPRGYEVVVRIRGGDESTVARAREVLGSALYAVGARPLEEVLGEALRDRGLTLATAESCTGGLLAQLITSVPGASDYFVGCAVAYWPKAKEKVLGVSGELIRRYTVYSEEVAEAMALGAARLFGSDLALSTTCVAGPTGGTPECPVGCGYLGLHFRGETKARRYQAGGDRTRVRRSFAKAALHWALVELTSASGS